MIKINKNTKLCISVSSTPGNTGATIHNHLYELYGLDMIYMPFACENIRTAIQAVRSLGIRGCSISMPFKNTVFHYIDDADESALVPSMINTVVNDGRILKGYNTDTEGALRMLKPMGDHKVVTLSGAGAAAHAVCCALADLGTEQIKIINRTCNNAWSLKYFIEDNFDIESKVIYSLAGDESDLFINCTCMGLCGEDYPIDDEILENYQRVVDVISADTCLIRRAKSLINAGRSRIKDVSSGLPMAIYQSLRQFELYTGHQIDIEDTYDDVRKLFDR